VASSRVADQAGSRSAANPQRHVSAPAHRATSKLTTKEAPMRQLTIDPPAHETPTRRQDGDPDGAAPEPSRLWRLIEALAYAGALLDPSGALVAQRYRRIQDVRRAR
jgi:hypothetical protein